MQARFSAPERNKLEEMINQQMPLALISEGPLSASAQSA
jgi:hypothetical protein